MSRRITTWMRHGKCPTVKCVPFKEYRISGMFKFTEAGREWWRMLEELPPRRAMTSKVWSQINRRRR